MGTVIVNVKCKCCDKFSRFESKNVKGGRKHFCKNCGDCYEDQKEESKIDTTIIIPFLIIAFFVGCLILWSIR
jgi:hypothetical protein